MTNQRKYIVISGGVISGLGKGVTGASIGYFFSQDYKVVPIKLDGYLNVDPGTMNPIEHGEVFVLDDGGEVDMDFGHYERFLGVSCNSSQSISMGKIFNSIRIKERNGKFLGKTVQMIPHVTNEIQDKIIEISKNEKSDITLVEIGGTIGDMENELFVEALRQLEKKVGKENICYVHLSYVPVPYGVSEQKTKPTQQSINLLQSKGIWPDFIVCRSSQILLKKTKEKIALFASLESEDIFSAPDLDSIYKIPAILEKQNLIEQVSNKLGIKVTNKNKIEKWKKLINEKINDEITITIAGKYLDLEDSYASIIEALKHCSYNFKIKINIEWIDTSKEIDYSKLKESNGVIVPGGFGDRGIEGKINVINYVRKNKIPFLGICYGLQLAVVEWIRNECNLNNANTTEVDPKTPHPVISLMNEQKEIVEVGGTMRLGKYEAKLNTGIISKLYQREDLISNENIVSERHRHRFEVNPKYAKIAEKKGLIISGKSIDRNLVEFIELPINIHPYFVATQSHPELKSKLEKPAPLFWGLVKEAIKNKN